MKWWMFGSAFCVLVGAVGCGGEDPPVPAAPVQSQQIPPPVPVAAPVPAVAPVAPVRVTPQVPRQEYSYNAVGKRDPFRSFILERAKQEVGQLRSPLEQFELHQLSVVAVVWDIDHARALINDPSGRAYIVQEGAPIGKNQGYIVHIADDMVVVRETYVDFLDVPTTKDVELRVRSESQGG